jgi:hypothetical protein
MSRRRGGHRSRRFKRDQKYVQFEEFEQPGPAPQPFLKSAIDDILDPPDAKQAVGERLRKMTTEQLQALFAKQVNRNRDAIRESLGPGTVIEGWAVSVEKDPTHLLDAGGSEP